MNLQLLVSAWLAALMATTSAAVINKRADGFVGYLFIHFYDNYLSPGQYTTYPAGERVFGHLSVNNDATDYNALNGGAPLLSSTVGTKAVRDFYLASKDDQSQHYIIATDLNQTAVGGFSGQFLSRGLVVWESQGSSLTKWYAPRLVNVVPDNFRMAWAPEATWIESEQRFLVYWSSNKYADASHSGSPDYDKIYYSYTSDFNTFTDPQVYLDLGNNVGAIDMTVHPTNETSNQFVRFFKDESVSKCRGQVSNDGLFGNWTDIGNGSEYVDNSNQSEACLFFKDNQSSQWWVWLDQYGRSPPGYYPYTADSGITAYGYTDHGLTGGMPSQTKHGAVKPLTQAQYDDLSTNQFTIIT